MLLLGYQRIDFAIRIDPNLLLSAICSLRKQHRAQRDAHDMLDARHSTRISSNLHTYFHHFSDQQMQYLITRHIESRPLRFFLQSHCITAMLR